MKKGLTIALAYLITGALSFASEYKAHWGYTGHNGPESWGTLSEEYKICATGMNQSPINITSYLDADLKPIVFHYKTSPTEILNNGHTVQVNVAAGSSIEVDGINYELKQYHFHTPSENNIDSKSYPLEAHFVHADKDGNLAVVGVMFEDGEENSQLKELWSKMPMESGSNTKLSTEASDLNMLLPKNKDYYRFNGSLTTPPCSEGVKWMVLGTPLAISKGQVEKFSHAVHGHNNRPIQPCNARVIIK